jgi:hypothetical protein
MGQFSARVNAVAGVAVGAGVGIGVGAGIYAGVAPILEQAAGGGLAELQGPLWNLVPLGAFVGGWVGLRLADSWHRTHAHGGSTTPPD